MGFTDSLGVSDVVTVALVTVTPEPPADPPDPVRPPVPSPTDTAAEATIEQTGAGPPPEAS